MIYSLNIPIDMKPAIHLSAFANLSLIGPPGNGGAEITFLISGDNGGWFVPRANQIKAYYDFMHPQNTRSKIPVSDDEYYMFRKKSETQNVRWTEIQDRTFPHKWRRIMGLAEAPPPS